MLFFFFTEGGATPCININIPTFHYTSFRQTDASAFRSKARWLAAAAAAAGWGWECTGKDGRRLPAPQIKRAPTRSRSTSAQALDKQEEAPHVNFAHFLRRRAAGRRAPSRQLGIIRILKRDEQPLSAFSSRQQT